MLLYANADGETIAVWRLAWDTPTDSGEFNAAYEELAMNWTGATPALLDADGTICWQGAIFSVCKTLVDGETLIVRAPQLEIARSVLEFESFNADQPVKDIIG
jgi:hypothetical protein